VQTSEDGDALSQLSYTQVWHSSPDGQPEGSSSASAAGTPSMMSSSSSSRAHGGRDDAALSMALVPYGAPSTPPHRRHRGRSYRETYTEEDSWTFVMDSQVRAMDELTVLPAPSRPSFPPGLLVLGLLSPTHAKMQAPCSHREAHTSLQLRTRLWSSRGFFGRGGRVRLTTWVGWRQHEHEEHRWSSRYQTEEAAGATTDERRHGRRRRYRASRGLPEDEALAPTPPVQTARQGATRRVRKQHCSVRVSVELGTRRLECGLHALYFLARPGYTASQRSRLSRAKGLSCC